MPATMKPAMLMPNEDSAPNLADEIRAITAERDALELAVGLAITMLDELGHDIKSGDKRDILAARAHKRAADLRAALAAKVWM